MTSPGSGARIAGRSRVLAWALWECGATGLAAITFTLVFPVYLTGSVGQGLSGGTSPASWLGRTLAIAGLTVAVLAPITGVWVQAPRLRREVLAVLTGLAVALTASMCLIRDDPSYFFAGLVLMAAGAACSDLASVPYNAMLRQLSQPQTSGKISGFGWAAGYLGSVVLLLVVYVGFIAGDGDTRGLLGISAHDGQNVRAAMLLAATWFALFALPLLLTAHSLAPDDPEDAVPHEHIGILGAYRKLWSDLSSEWRRDRNLVYYLLASAVFRDGIAGVFAFGAVLGVNVYGISQATVLVYGVIASVVAAGGALGGGYLDHRIGSKTVIVGSLTAMIAAGLTLLALSGSVAFWVCTLLLCLFVGPTQSSARTLLLRMSPEGGEGVAFGLYTMTGRAVSFLAPWLFSLFVDLFHTDRAGLAGVCVVLLAGLVAMIFVRTPRRDDAG